MKNEQNDFISKINDIFLRFLKYCEYNLHTLYEKKKK